MAELRVLDESTGEIIPAEIVTVDEPVEMNEDHDAEGLDISDTDGIEIDFENMEVGDEMVVSNNNESGDVRFGTNDIDRIRGDVHSYVYFDTEFTGLKKDTTLISVGLCDNYGRTFYAVLTDYNKDDLSEWVLEAVIKHLDTPEENVISGNDWRITGSKAYVGNKLEEWLEYISEKTGTIQFVADVGHYDFVLLIDLLLSNREKYPTEGATALDLPKYISPVLYDINQDLGTRIVIDTEAPEYKGIDGLVPVNIAFDMPRARVCEDLGVKRINQHNALNDALITAAIHRSLWHITV